MSLRFFADQCVGSEIIRMLREGGNEVLKLSDHISPDSPDPAVIAKAQELGCILLSLNGDFADLITYPPRKYGGIVALQVRNHPEVVARLMRRLMDYLSAHLEQDEYQQKLFLVEVHRIRIRQ